MTNGLSSVTGNRVYSGVPDTGRISVTAGENNKEQSPPQDSVSLGAGEQPAKTGENEPFSSTTTASDGKKAKVKVFPQDPLMGPPAVEEIDSSKISKDLSNPRVIIEDRNNPKAIPDLEGNYLFEPLTPQFDQINALVTTTRAIDMCEGFIGHKINWSFGDDQITVLPHSKEGANAYYARWEGALNLMFFKSDGLKKIVQTAQSADIISHELGHAILDGMRPNFISSWGTETRAYHEAFADMISMLYTLSDPENRKKVVEETGGDLSKNNRISMLAEEFGKAVHLRDGDPTNDNNTWLRNAINDFKYVDPATLPKEGPRDKLTAEPHSFARIFSGAFYDIIQHTYNSHLQRRGDGNKEEALKSTQEHLGKLLLKSVDLSAASGCSFRTMALSMLKADEMLNEGVNKQDLIDVFKQRNILTDSDIEQYQHSRDDLPKITLDRKLKDEKEALAFLKQHEEKLRITAEDFTKAQVDTDTYGNTIVQYGSLKEINLKDHGIYKVVGNENNLYSDLHGGMTLCFDRNGDLISLVKDTVTPAKVDEAVKGIKEAVNDDSVRQQPLYKTDNMFKRRSEPYAAEVYQEPSGKFKLQRLPVMILTPEY